MRNIAKLGVAMGSAAITIDSSGRLVIPKEIRERLKIDPKTELVMTVEGDEIRLMTREAARKRAQEEARQYVPEGVSMVDEVIADKRREAALEEEKRRRLGY